MKAKHSVLFVNHDDEPVKSSKTSHLVQSEKH